MATKKTYSDLLKDPRWQKRRLEILSRDKFTCQFCGDKESTLHVHHWVYRGKPWEANDMDMCTICEHCHFIEHQKKGLSSLEKTLLEWLIYPVFIDYNKIKKDRLIRMLTLSDEVKISRKKEIAKLLGHG